jgi:hypothetical protein
MPIAILVQFPEGGIYRGESYLKDVPRIVKFRPKTDQIPSELGGGSRTQFPLNLAYALTIHKAQGGTYERVVLDLGKDEFDIGLSYVGMSRVRELRHLFFDPMPTLDRLTRWGAYKSMRDRQIEEEIIEQKFYATIRSKYDAIVNRIRSSCLPYSNSTAPDASQNQEQRFFLLNSVLNKEVSAHVPWRWKCKLLTNDKFVYSQKHHTQRCSCVHHTPCTPHLHANGRVIHVVDVLKALFLGYRSRKDVKKALASLTPNDTDRRQKSYANMEEKMKEYKSKKQLLDKQMKDDFFKAQQLSRELNAAEKSKTSGTGSFEGYAGVDNGPSEDEDDDDSSDDSEAEVEKVQPPEPSQTPWSRTNEYMLSVRSNYACPIFPSFEHLEVNQIELPPIHDTSNLVLRLRLTDYFRGTSSGGTWEPLLKWLHSLNFEIVRDYGASQIGNSCGIVAAKVSSWLKESKPEANSNFMHLNTWNAVSRNVLRHANSILRNYGDIIYFYIRILYHVFISLHFPCQKTNLANQAIKLYRGHGENPLC